ncbi:unnamed protein product [Rotaria socialis]|uniref:Uncharacterized protein n=3 Tax=Rotaria socialis TaxID=392032 RepID=A0A817T733_9BILA|nr:unnamed protein product [Rotaria socialis]
MYLWEEHKSRMSKLWLTQSNNSFADAIFQWFHLPYAGYQTLSTSLLCITRKKLNHGGGFDRYDKLVDRYHNNVHFMKWRAQLLRDLILYRLPTSVHSQSTILGASAAPSSQVDYGERKIIQVSDINQYSSSIIDWYTKATSDHRILNHTLRQKQLHDIVCRRHTIVALINSLRRPLTAEEDGTLLILLRAQKMTIFELEKMKHNIGEIISAAPFLSTTMNPQIAEIFVGDGSDDNPYLVSVILKIYLDTGQEMRPYARIYNSAEEEVLLSPGTKFVLKSCKQIDDKERRWLLELYAISEKQQEKVELTYGETFMLLNEASGWPKQSWLFIQNKIT